MLKVNTELKTTSNNTKAARLSAELLLRIADGIYKPGSQLPGCRALAQEFDLSYVTASLAVKAVVDSGAARSRRGCGVFVTDFQLERPTERRVKLICPQVESPSVIAFLSIGTKIFGAADWQMEQIGQSDFDKIVDDIADFRSFSVLFGFGFDFYRKLMPEIERMRAWDRVVVWGERCERYRVASIIADEPELIRSSMKLLHQAGRHHVALLCGNICNSVEQERLSAWRNFRRQFLPDDDCWQTLFFDMEILGADGDEQVFGEKYLQKLLVQGKLAKIDGLITPDPNLAIVALNFLQKNGFHVPGDIALVSIGDAHYLNLVSPKVTVIDPDLTAHMKTTLEILENKLHGKTKQPLLYLCNPHLIVRESTPVPEQVVL